MNQVGPASLSAVPSLRAKAIHQSPLEARATGLTIRLSEIGGSDISLAGVSLADQEERSTPRLQRAVREPLPPVDGTPLVE